MSHAQNWLQVVYAVRQRRPVTILGVTYVPQDTRPLVVIDPEDREQIDRLMRAYEPSDYGHEDRADFMQAALREFADPKPPRPDEPHGLGAVVEDADGVLWTLVNDGGCWIPKDRGLEGRGWGEFKAVRVLHDGWRA